MSIPQYIGLIAALFYVGGCADPNPQRQALNEYAAIMLGLIAVVTVFVFHLT